MLRGDAVTLQAVAALLCGAGRWWGNLMGRSEVAAVAICLVGMLSACATPADVGSAIHPVSVSEALDLSKADYAASYVVGAGDAITVRFYYNPQLDEDLNIQPDGNLSLSLIGVLPAAGKSITQLSDDITKAYGEYLAKPTATVLLRTSANARAFVEGQVGHPGEVDLGHSALTALQSISFSGGFLETADLGDVILIRRITGRPAPIVVELNLARAADGSDPQDDMVLLPNDYVYVPRSGAAELNLAMRLYLFQNLNLSTSVTGTTTFPSPGPK
jgi:polysaccharide biosynthesis/export protein